MKKLLSWLLLFAMLLGTFSTLAVAVGADTTELTNVALGKEVTVDRGSNKNAINDGNKSTLWDASGDYDAEAVIDLAGYYKIPTINVITWSGTVNGQARYYQYEIWTSIDGNEYQKAAEKKDDVAATGSGTSHSIDEAVTARYVKIIMTYDSAHLGRHLHEVEVYGYEDPDYAPPSTNVALGKPVTVDRGTDADRITDGNRARSYWSADGNSEAWAEIDLEGYFRITSINVETWYGNVSGKGDRYYKYEIWTSVDGIAYKKFAEKTDETVATADGITHTSEKSVTARYVKILMTYDSFDWGRHICEVEVNGYKDPAYDDYSPTPKPTNVALGKVGKAFSTDSKNEAYATDGDKNNWKFWEASKYPATLEVDLKKVYKLTSFVCFNLVEGGRYYNYEIYTSTDGQNYILAATKDSTDAATADGDTLTLDTPVSARYVRITTTYNSNNTGVHLVEFEAYGYEDPDYRPTPTNVALRKNVISLTANCSKEHHVTDGDMNTWGFWEAKQLPASLEIDLEKVYVLSSFVCVNFFADTRYYNYNIYTSIDGDEYTLVAAKTSTDVATGKGDTLTLDTPVSARYVKVTTTYNSLNPAAHIVEFEAYGYEDPDYVDYKPTHDPLNIAYGKPTYTNIGSEAFSNRVTDGRIGTNWVSEYYPTYVDVDLGDTYDISEIILNFPTEDDSYYYYTVYGSNDYSKFDRIARNRTKDIATLDGDTITLSNARYRFIRVLVEYVSNSGSASLSEIRVHGTPTETNMSNLRSGSVEEILGIKAYDETEYAKPITEEETIENVYGIIDRTVGSAYRGWFTFAISPNTLNDNDYFTVENTSDGKILITGNDGVMLASGLNYYYKNYCNVCITEQANNVTMPGSVVKVDSPVRRETPYKIRYAFNYCTLDYTFAFFGANDYQRENDWLALNGVNLVLDLAGQEAVWTSFLMKIGYTFDEAKEWLSGPGYCAWQFMGNLETIGGTISDDYIVARLNMARENQRFKNSLGMQTVLQGYAGMVPTDFSTKNPGVAVLKQGKWAGLDRPYIIRTDSDVYDKYADYFYESQKWALGDTSDYYAVDPFHEGGIRPSDLTDNIISAEVLSSLLKNDKNAVWVVQSWVENPTKALLDGMGEYRNGHVLILDLRGNEIPNYNKTTYGGSGKTTTLNSVEFEGTDWVLCTLKNYGGRPAISGRINNVTKIPSLTKDCKHMMGIGIISEAMQDNPLYYDLFFDMVWQTEDIDFSEWLKSYITRRYGEFSQNIYDAWMLLRDTSYTYDNDRWQILTMKPEMPLYNYDFSTQTRDNEAAKQALSLMHKEFDKFSGEETYIYDLAEIMRQVVSNYAIEYFYASVKPAYESRDKDAFDKAKAEFLSIFDIADNIGSLVKEQLLGEWIGKATDLATDDFSYDMFAANAKMLITTWGGYNTAWEVLDYSYKNYSGMMKDLYKVRWKNYLDGLSETLVTGEYEKEEAMTTSEKLNVTYKNFYFYWEWIMNTPEYTRTPDASPENAKAIAASLLALIGENSEKNTLEALIAKSEGIETRFYTESTVNNFNTALASAKNVLADSSSDESAFAVAAEELKTAVAGLTTFLSFEGFKVRLADYNGLRSIFRAQKDMSVSDRTLTVKEYGSLVASTEALPSGSSENLVLTKGENGEYIAETGIKATVYKDGNIVSKILDDTGDYIEYALTATKFDKTNFDKKLSFRGYIIFSDGENEYVFYVDYANENYRSLSLAEMCDGMYESKLIDESAISYSDVMRFRSENG